ncbi:MAG TPA: peptidoglycan bridge formation glycyltransferase FemA/FemB family protein [Candidatus Woesebacteria bacterium]|nr:peptidoglycan bridge formation glycyltransferase FemA/FemB family protein [Candidatus Woesebacteria bacterium]
MKIQEITDKNEWNTFLNKQKAPSLHHAWEWGEFQKQLHYNILRLGIYDNKKLISIALVIKIKSKRGNFLFIPHGPIFNIPAEKLTVTIPSTQESSVVSILTELTDYLSKIATNEGFSFIRMAPILSNLPEHASILKRVGYRQAPIYIHAETMWAVDVSQSEEDMLKNMRKNTRYLVKKGIKDAIEITQHTDMAAINAFWQLYEQTFTREHFTPFPKSYVTAEFKAFNAEKAAAIFLGKMPSNFDLEGPSKYLAASLVLFTNITGFYHQGASTHSDYPVTYQLQWQTMLEAKRRGCTYYNFYGIYNPGRTPRAWQGLSLFKRGFGGFQVDYVPTHDYVISPLYIKSYLIDKYLAFKRGI